MNKIHLIIISTINFILIALMIRAAWQGNDKAILIPLILYPILTLLNAIIWIMLLIFKHPESKTYKWNTIGMVLFFIPALMIASFY